MRVGDRHSGLGRGHGPVGDHRHLRRRQLRDRGRRPRLRRRVRCRRRVRRAVPDRRYRHQRRVSRLDQRHPAQSEQRRDRLRQGPLDLQLQRAGPDPAATQYHQHHPGGPVPPTDRLLVHLRLLNQVLQAGVGQFLGDHRRSVRGGLRSLGQHRSGDRQPAHGQPTRAERLLHRLRAGRGRRWRRRMTLDRARRAVAIGGLIGWAAIAGIAAPAGAAASLTPSAGTPQNQNTGQAFPTDLAVSVPCANTGTVKVTFTAPSSGASGTFANTSGPTTQTTVDCATANTPVTATASAFTANGVAGSYSVAATDDAGDGPASFSLTNDGLSAVAGTPQTTKIGSPFPTPLQVSVFTGTPGPSAGSPASGVTVTFTAPTSGASGVFSSTNTYTASVQTNAQGLATAPAFTANQTAGTYSVTASASGISGSAGFLLTNSNAGVSSGVTAYTGSNQSATVASAYSSPLQAQVLDPNGNPVQGATVTFASPSGTNPGVTFAGGGATATASTNSAGIATSPPLTANTTAGTFTVTASTAGVANPATFSLDNLPGPPASIATGAGASQATPVGTPFPVSLAVTVYDSYKNPVPGTTVTFASPATGAGGVFSGEGSTATVSTDSSGVAVAPTFTANGTEGGYVVTASVSGLGQMASFSLVNQAPSASASGYRLVSADGGVFSYGSNAFYGSAGDIHLAQPIVGMAATPDGHGYWLVASDGGVFTYGDAAFYGSAGDILLARPIVGMAATPDGHGYWLVASDGGVFTYGDAAFYGSAGDILLARPIVGMAATPDGHGYWLVASDGGVFTYGDAGFLGSAGAIRLIAPVVGMAVTPDGNGYWLVASDGGIFNYGDAGFFGSGSGFASQVVGMAATPDGHGYWLASADGVLVNLGDAGFAGSPAGVTLAKPIVGVAE